MFMKFFYISPTRIISTLGIRIYQLFILPHANRSLVCPSKLPHPILSFHYENPIQFKYVKINHLNLKFEVNLPSTCSFITRLVIMMQS